jgi:hypothetical protein
VDEETKSLDQLYADAKREGAKLVIYAGGDTADQQDAAKQGFLSQFPDIDSRWDGGPSGVAQAA